VNTIAATSQRIPRPALIGIVVVVVAFAALMIVRGGLLGGGSSESGSTASSSPATSSSAATQSHSSAVTPAQPKVVLLPGLPPQVAHALRYSKVTVVSLYVGQAQSDRKWVAAARKGARSAGAGFVAVNVGDDRTAASVSAFAGAASSPSMLVVKRPGKIVTQIAGPVDAAVVQQAAHNAGARR
jgi:hypothetical protein